MTEQRAEEIRQETCAYYGQLVRERGKPEAFALALDELCKLKVAVRLGKEGEGVRQNALEAVAAACSYVLGDCPNAPGFPEGACGDCSTAAICYALGKLDQAEEFKGEA